MALRVREYDNERHLCALINYPATGLYDELKIELAINNNINFTYLTGLETVDFDNAIEKNEQQVYEGMTLKGYTDYAFVIRYSLADWKTIVDSALNMSVNVVFNSSTHPIFRHSPRFSDNSELNGLEIIAYDGCGSVGNTVEFYDKKYIIDYESMVASYTIVNETGSIFENKLLRLLSSNFCMTICL